MIEGIKQFGQNIIKPENRGSAVLLGVGVALAVAAIIVFVVHANNQAEIAKANDRIKFIEEIEFDYDMDFDAWLDMIDELPGLNHKIVALQLHQMSYLVGGMMSGIFGVGAIAHSVASVRAKAADQELAERRDVNLI